MSNQPQSGSSQQAAGAGGVALLSAALLQEVLGLTERLLEEVVRAVAERVQERVLEEVEGRVRQAVEREMRAMQENIRRMEEQMAALQATVESRGQSVDVRKNNQQRAIEPFEERLLQAERGQMERETTAELSDRMERVEASLQRTLTSMTPKMGALVAQLEAPRTAATSPAACASCAPPPAVPRPLSPATRERLGASLVQAVERGGEGRVRELLEPGADVDARDSRGWSPLHWAARGGRDAVVALLLRRGADARAKDMDGWAALHFAAERDTTGRCVSLFPDAGMNVDGVDNKGQTPLHFAAFDNNEAAVRVLLAAGADRTARDRRGIKPLDLALSHAIRRLLCDSSATGSTIS